MIITRIYQVNCYFCTWYASFCSPSLKKTAAKPFYYAFVLTNVQLLEKVLGSIDVSWYNILQTIITHVQTVQILDASGRNWAYGKARAQAIKNTKLNRDTWKHKNSTEITWSNKRTEKVWPFPLQVKKKNHSKERTCRNFEENTEKKFTTPTITQTQSSKWRRKNFTVDLGRNLPLT